VYDPKTRKITMIDTCFNTHHLQFDKQGVLWFSAGGNYDVVGWLDMKKWDQTHDAAASQGWAPFVIDVNGNGKRDIGWTEPNAPTDNAKDKRMVLGFYGASPNPVDGTIWGGVVGFPGGVVRYDPKTSALRVLRIPLQESEEPAVRLLTARFRYRQQRRVLGRAFERTSRELRPQPVQGKAERSRRGRSAEPLPGRLQILSDARTFV
jgi:hypothetical protein